MPNITLAPPAVLDTARLTELMVDLYEVAKRHGFMLGREIGRVDTHLPAVQIILIQRTDQPEAMQARATVRAQITAELEGM